MIWLKELLTILPAAIAAYNTRKQTKLDAEVKIEQAKTAATVERIARGEMHEYDWEIEQIRNSSWKDEWFVMVFSVPMVMSFIPGYDVYVTSGFAVLETTPEWYRWMLAAIVGATFGYRKMVDFMDRKR